MSNKLDQVIFSNIAAITTAAFVLRGGSYWLETKSTGAGTIDLQKLGPDGSTFTARATQIVATAGQQTISLPPGTYKVAITGFTANFVELTRIPTATD